MSQLPPPSGPQDRRTTPSFGEPPPAPARAAAQPATSPARPFNPLVLVGAVGVFISLFTEWGTEKFFGESFAGSDIPIEFLNDTTPASFDSTSITFLLVPAIAAMLVGLFVAQVRWLSLIGAIGATLVGAWYLKAVQAVIDEYGFRAGLTDLVGVGTWICIGSGVVGGVGGVLLLRTRSAATVPADGPGSAQFG